MRSRVQESHHLRSRASSGSRLARWQLRPWPAGLRGAHQLPSAVTNKLQGQRLGPSWRMAAHGTRPQHVLRCQLSQRPLSQPQQQACAWGAERLHLMTALPLQLAAAQEADGAPLQETPAGLKTPRAQGLLQMPRQPRQQLQRQISWRQAVVYAATDSLLRLGQQSGRPLVQICLSH